VGVQPSRLRRARITYALDALGDAGLSVQIRPIRDATDEHYAVKLPLPERITANQLRGLRMPVYAALARRSVMHDGAHAADVARAEIRDSTIELWPDATHSLPMEETAQLDRTILAFMASHDG
jgi:pimeloyl-ACP methyl ester carboxylesterase